MAEDDLEQRPVAPPGPRDGEADAVRIVLAVAGASLVGLGAGLHYVPLGFILPGVMIFGIALVGALRARP